MAWRSEPALVPCRCPAQALCCGRAQRRPPSFAAFPDHAARAFAHASSEPRAGSACVESRCGTRYRRQGDDHRGRCWQRPPSHGRHAGRAASAGGDASGSRCRPARVPLGWPSRCGTTCSRIGTPSSARESGVSGSNWATRYCNRSPCPLPVSILVIRSPDCPRTNRARAQQRRPWALSGRPPTIRPA